MTVVEYVDNLSDGDSNDREIADGLWALARAAILMLYSAQVALLEAQLPEMLGEVRKSRC